MRPYALVVHLFLFPALGAASVGCGDDGGRPLPDAAETDASADAGFDAGSDGSTSDTGTSPDGAMADASFDATADASSDATADADADASFECTADADCDDGDVCNGTDNCLDGFCVSVDAPNCDDGDPCTADTCDPVSGCDNTLVDVDGDGYAPSTMDPSCMDCDDTEMTAYPGAPDMVCDGIDSDCDDAIDEDGIITHFADCDGDRYPAADAETTLSCATPSTPPSSCPSGASGATWTDFDTWIDCNDANAGVSPGISGYRPTPIPGAGSAEDYDYNCNGVEEQRWTTLGSCVPNGASTGSACTLTEGWQTSVPECGATGLYIDTCAMSPGPGGVWECIARGNTITAPCR